MPTINSAIATMLVTGAPGKVPASLLAAGETGAEVAPMSEREPVAEMPEPAEAEEATPEPAPVDEAEPEIVVAEDNRTPAPEPEAAPEPEPTAPAKRRRRTRCATCGTLHFKEEACPPSEDA